MDPASIVEVTERTRFCPQTDGQKDRWCETSIAPFQLRWSGGYNNMWLYSYSVTCYKSCESWVYTSIITVQPIMYANNRIHYVSKDCIHLFAYYTIPLLSSWRITWGHWSYKMLVRYILLSVYIRLSLFSQYYLMEYMGLCVISLPISPLMIHFIANIKSEISIISHCSRIGHETMLCTYGPWPTIKCIATEFTGNMNSPILTLKFFKVIYVLLFT